MVVTNEILLNVIKENHSQVLREVNAIKRNLRGKSVEEVSLNKACKLLHVGYEQMIGLIHTKKIKARAINSKKSKNGITYKIKLSEIEHYQDKPDVELKLVISKSVEQVIQNYHQERVNA